MDLTRRRQEIIAEHQAMEKYDPHWKAEADKGQKISERPIAFQDDDEIVVTGDCVEKVFAGLQKFIDLVDSDAGEVYLERAKKEPVVAQAITKTRRALESDPPKEIRVHTQTWNAYGFGLDEVGVHVVLTDGRG